MITDKNLQQEYYKALLAKDSAYEGVFWVGVKTTEIFCRPTCPARKPKFGHCDFFATPKEALLASFRPCKRCQPLSNPNMASNVIQTLIQAVELDPEKRWKNSDFDALSIHAATARRQFKKRFGMTFVEYSRSRRLGIAMGEIRKGTSVIDAQVYSGYESGSGFRDAFSRIMGTSLISSNTVQLLYASWLDTPLGPMCVIADHDALYLLEFVDRRGLEKEVENLRNRKIAIIPGRTAITDMIEQELKLYFSGKLQQFLTPIQMIGSVFQKTVWQTLLTIPLGKTCSYLELAKQLNKPTAFRAAANANGRNQLAIIIPCHRVINTNGALGGYSGGLVRKKWLLSHEQEMIKNNHEH